VIPVTLPLLALTLLEGGGGSSDELIATTPSSGAIMHTVENRPPPIGPGPPAPEILQGLANQTRGQFKTIYSPASYQVVLDHLSERLGTEIMIHCIVPTRSDRSDVMIGGRFPGGRVKGLGIAPK
jgi:hypothetical protein